jgi:hypothetical protein
MLIFPYFKMKIKNENENELRPSLGPIQPIENSSKATVAETLCPASDITIPLSSKN